LKIDVADGPAQSVRKEPEERRPVVYFLNEVGGYRHG